jgi:hypothetical protein
MNLLSTILDRLNQRIEVGNIFDKIYGLSELVGEGNDKAWAYYIGNGQSVPVTDFDAKQGTLFWAKRGKITVAKNDSLRLAGCKSIYETKFSMTAYAMVRKSHLPCDSADAQDWVASRVLRLISGTDPQFKTAIGVIAYEVVPNGYQNEIRYLPVNYEWAAVAIDVDVNVSTSSEDGCYDTCATGDIPLPDFEPCTPCLTEVAVDGITIIGNGTPEDPLIAIGGGGGGGALIALPFTTDHLSATGNAYAIGNIVWYNGNVYRCIAANDSILPTNTSYWVNLGAGFPTVQQPSNWNATSGNNQILNKPTIPAAQVNSDWNSSSGVSEILNKPSLAAVATSGDYADLINTPSIPPAQVNSDWNATSGVAEILNKPTIPTSIVESITATSPITSTGGTTPDISTSMNTNKLIGRGTAGTGPMEEITVGSGLTLTGAGVLNNTATPTPTGYYGAFQDDTTQTAVSANTAYPVKFNTTDLSNGVTVVNDGSGNPTRVTLANTGIYNVQFSLQLEKTGGSGNFIIDIWLRKNGVDIPDTAGKVVLTGSANASPIVAAWNYLLDLAGGDYVQLMWSTSNNNAIIIAEGPVAPHPGVPSSILTVTQQAGIMAGTGITAINSLTGAVQTIGIGTTGTDFAVVSSGTSHTFNLPTASASNRGALSTADWSKFDGKFDAPSGTTAQYVRGDGTLATMPISTFKSTTDSATITGTANQLVQSQIIAANTYTVGDIIRLTFRTQKSTTTANMTVRVYINTANNLTGANLIATYSSVGLYGQIERRLFIKSATVTQSMLSTFSFQTDTGTTNGITNTNIDWTQTQYIILAAQQTTGTDTTLVSGYLIEKL